MKKLSDRHVEYLHKSILENKSLKKDKFLNKIGSLLEKYNCTSLDELNESNSVKFIEDMISESEEEKEDSSNVISNIEYLEHVINSSSDPEKVKRAEALLNSIKLGSNDDIDSTTDSITVPNDTNENASEELDLDKEDENAESMQNGSVFKINKNNSEISVMQKSFDKDSGIFIGLDVNGNEIEYTADDVIM